MTRVQRFSAVSALILGLSAPALAFSAESIDPLLAVDSTAPGYSHYAAMVHRLDSDGSVIIEIEKTFLGRLRLLCVSDGQLREIIFSPNTGQIRRDVVLGAYDGTTVIANGNATGKGRAPSERGKSDSKGKSKGK